MCLVCARICALKLKHHAPHSPPFHILQLCSYKEVMTKLPSVFWISLPSGGGGEKMLPCSIHNALNPCEWRGQGLSLPLPPSPAGQDFIGSQTTSWDIAFESAIGSKCATTPRSDLGIKCLGTHKHPSMCIPHFMEQ